jgi:hypothetical protein
MRDSEYNANEQLQAVRRGQEIVDLCKDILTLPLTASPAALAEVVRIGVTLPEPGARCAYHERVAQEQYARAKAYVERMDKARQARIDRGEECPKCKGGDIERQEFCGVIVCRCGECWFDTRGAK